MKKAMLILSIFVSTMLLSCGSRFEPFPDFMSRRGHSAVVYNDAGTDKMYVFGGYGSGDFLNDLWVYDPTLEPDPWTQLNPPSSPPGRAYHAAVISGGDIYIFGGYSGQDVLKPVYYNDLWQYNIAAGTWSQVTLGGTVPAARFGHSAATDGTYIYSFGGKSDSSTYLDEFLRCHLTTHSCETPLVTGPSARAFHSVSMAGTTMYIFGGEFSDGSTVDKLDDLWTIPLPPTTWTEEVPALSTAAPSSAYHAAVKYGTKLYFFGGNDVIVDTVWAWESTRTSYGNEMIAFVDGGGGNDQITDTANGFVAAGFLSGDDIVVSGSASNDGAYTILAITAGTIDVATGSLTDEAAGAAVTIRTGYAGSTIAFDVGDTVTDLITDSANGFVAAGFQEGDDIVVSGSASNDGQYTILSVDAGTIKVAEARLTAESAGASVTLTELDWAQRTKPASSPLGRRAPTAVVMNDGTDDRMYLFGGQSGGVGINTLWAYKLSDAAAAVENLFTWEQMTSIPSQ